VPILRRSSSRDEVIDDCRLGVRVIGDVKQRALDNRAQVPSKSRWAFRCVKRGTVDQRRIDGSQELGNPLSDQVIAWARPHLPCSLPDPSPT
jgi:hypothetical protein